MAHFGAYTYVLEKTTLVAFVDIAEKARIISVHEIIITQILRIYVSRYKIFILSVACEDNENFVH